MPHTNCPPGTVSQKFVSFAVSVECSPEWYFTDGSMPPESDTSMPPTYATQENVRPNTKLQ